MSRHIKSETLNGTVCIPCVGHTEHPLRRIEHPICRKYPIVYVLLSVVPIEPFIVHLGLLNKTRKNENKKSKSNSI